MHREPPHYLRPLKSTTTPDRLIWLDCATTTTKERGAYVKRFECAALGTTHWTSTKRERRDVMTVYRDPVELWWAVNRFCTKGKRVVLFAHDLATQIRTSKAMLFLPKFGWSLESIVLERTAAWASYRDDKRSLLLCDLRSWAPVELGAIASDLTHGSVRGFEANAGPDFLPDVCMQRAQCVRDAMLQIFAWIEGENLGPFRPTGSGQSYSAYRRRFMREPLLVHDDTARLAAERLAMHTGRCEAWRHGKLEPGPFVEYDMHAAYCTIVAGCDVPTVARTPIWQPTPARVKRAMESYAVLAHVTVTTDVPVLPTRLGGRTLWPTGTFDTWVWDPELRLAFDHCREVKVHEAYRYVRGPALREFGGWVLDGIKPQTQIYGLVPRRVLKHWSRCLVGRLGLRYRTWTKFASQPEIDLRLHTYLDVEEGVSSDMLVAGHDWLLLTDMHEALESLPQVPSWVMSMCRRQLWCAMERAGIDRVVYVDTDSMICTADQYVDELFRSDVTYGSHWNIKGTYSRMVIHGPRNLVCEDARRVSGLPLTARQTAPLEFTGQVMRSIKESMRAGELDCVAEIPRTFHMNATDLRRQHLPDGQTRPYHVRPTKQEDY